VATSQSTTGTEEAKDFKVVVTLDQIGGQNAIPDELRPGLSCTAKIVTANKPNTLTIPIQALVQRDLPAEQTLFTNHGKAPTTVAASIKPTLTQGVYLLVKDKDKLRVKFTPVTTGITGATDIEVLTGLKADDEIVTGHFKILRSLKSGTAVKRDNTVEPITTDSSS